MGRLNHKQQVWMDQRLDDDEERVLPWVWVDEESRKVACMVRHGGAFHALYAFAPEATKTEAA